MVLSYIPAAAERLQHPQLGMEKKMSSKHIQYLRREHARLEAEIDREARRGLPDEVLIARLKKLKLAVKDQIATWSYDTGGSRVA
jgi:hypothetical protein